MFNCEYDALLLKCCVTSFKIKKILTLQKSPTFVLSFHGSILVVVFVTISRLISVNDFVLISAFEFPRRGMTAYLL